MYNWRKISDRQREEALTLRRGHNLPWHSPPHFGSSSARRFLLSAACYNHRPVIGVSSERMTECEADVLAACEKYSVEIFAWCFLPNHYHVLLKTDQLEILLEELGKFHGRSARRWNIEDRRPGRKVWFNCFDRKIKSDRHFWASMNYVHHNPVHHGYVQRWQDWPWSSARRYLAEVGEERAEEIWREYPILDYGKKWDK